MTDIISTAIAVVRLPGINSRQAASLLIESINADLGTRYTTDYLSKWRRAERPIPQHVQDWMLRTCIASAIRQCGGIPPDSDDQLDRLAAMICPPICPPRT